MNGLETHVRLVIGGRDVGRGRCAVLGCKETIGTGLLVLIVDRLLRKVGGHAGRWYLGSSRGVEVGRAGRE